MLITFFLLRAKTPQLSLLFSSALLILGRAIWISPSCTLPTSWIDGSLLHLDHLAVASVEEAPFPDRAPRPVHATVRSQVLEGAINGVELEEAGLL